MRNINSVGPQKCAMHFENDSGWEMVKSILVAYLINKINKLYVYSLYD